MLANRRVTGFAVCVCESVCFLCRWVSAGGPTVRASVHIEEFLKGMLLRGQLGNKLIRPHMVSLLHVQTQWWVTCSSATLLSLQRVAATCWLVPLCLTGGVFPKCPFQPNIHETSFNASCVRHVLSVSYRSCLWMVQFQGGEQRDARRKGWQHADQTVVMLVCVLQYDLGSGRIVQQLNIANDVGFELFTYLFCGWVTTRCGPWRKWTMDHDVCS